MAPARLSTLLAATSAAWVCYARAAAPALDDAVLQDDECAVGEDCALNALQLRAAIVDHPSSADLPPAADGPPAEGDDDDDDDSKPLIAGANPAWSDPANMGVGPEEEDGELGAATEADSSKSYCARHLFQERCGLYAHCMGRPYCVFGNYMVVPGKPCPGMEAINGGNARSYDYLFGVARSRCGDPGCVLMTNPVGHRTQDQLHIHFRRMIKMGPAMKTSLEAATCHASGWVPFSPHCCGCGHGKARAFSGYPGVFSEVAKAFGGGSLGSVGISVFFGCGKTIILATTHCSIEHSVSER